MSKPVASCNSMGFVVETSETISGTMVTWREFIGITQMGIVVLNLITTFTGLWLALEFTGLSLMDNILKVLTALLGASLVIAGGCALNNFIDRDIDQLMACTSERPSATGKITGRQVFWSGIVMAGLGTLFLLQVSLTSAIFGLLGLIFYVVVYTMWLKRTHSINIVVGGVSCAVPPVIGWTVIDPSVSSMIPWLLFLILFLWQPPHFLAHSMKHVEEYRRAGIPMLSAIAGLQLTKRQMILYIVLLLPASLLLYELGPLYLSLACLLGIVWLAIGISGLFMKDILKWAKWMFVFSLNYLTLLFVAMIVSVFF